MPFTLDPGDFDQLAQRHPQSVRILVAGDSWSAYPRRDLISGQSENTVQILAKNPAYLILSFTSSCDQGLCMLSAEQKIALSQSLRRDHLDVILFSAGGNEILGPYDFDFFLLPMQPRAQLQDCIHWHRLDNKLDQIRAVFIEFIERVREYAVNSDTPIITHTYDYARPNPADFELFDLVPIGESWLYPFFKRKGYRDRNVQQQLVQMILQRFRKMILELAGQYPQLRVADTQGLLSDHHWSNEIYPNAEGFKLISMEIERQMMRAYQDG